MNNIRKIIEERLENARNDIKECLSENKVRELVGTAQAYQDCLNLMQPRTEQEILADFEKLGWKVTQNDEDDFTLRLKGNPTCTILIDKLTKEYSMSCCLDMQEHKLLNELFNLWGWL